MAKKQIDEPKPMEINFIEFWANLLVERVIEEVEKPKSTQETNTV